MRSSSTVRGWRHNREAFFLSFGSFGRAQDRGKDGEGGRKRGLSIFMLSTYLVLLFLLSLVPSHPISPYVIHASMNSLSKHISRHLPLTFSFPLFSSVTLSLSPSRSFVLLFYDHQIFRRSFSQAAKITVLMSVLLHDITLSAPASCCLLLHTRGDKRGGGGGGGAKVDSSG